MQHTPAGRPPGMRAGDSKVSPRKRSDLAILGGPVLIALPLVTFTAIICLISFAFHHYSVLVLCLVVACYFLAFFFAWLNSRGRISGRWYLFLSVVCVFADCCGTAAGVYNYRVHMFQYWTYEDRRAYTNVLPTERAAAIADGGKIIFSNSARIDTTRAVGFKSGKTYCVAPILADQRADSVEMWAVGMDCCPMRGDFSCDDAWNPVAKGGVAVVEPFNILAGPTSNDMYLKAVKLAAGAYGLKVPSQPLLVRWVADPQGVQDEAWRSGIGFIVSAICTYSLFSLLVGFIAHQMSRRAASSDAAEG